MSTLHVKTQEKRQIIDITDKIESLVKNTEAKNGVLTVFAKHTTCAVIISEFENGIIKDILKYINQAGPKGPFEHSHGSDDHAPSHILSALIGQSRSIPLKQGKLQLGTWQRICLLELDGPREREIEIAIT